MSDGLSTPPPGAFCCRDVVERATDYLEDVLPEPAAHAVAEHLQACTACRSYLEQIKISIALARSLPPPQPDPELLPRLLRAFRGWKDES